MPPPPAPTSDDPRITFNTTYQNVRPEVKFVGDQACAACHPLIAESYHRHPMGRSLVPMARVAAQERLEKSTRNPFDQLGVQFAVERRGDQVFHKAIRRDGQGHTLADFDAEVLYVLGSGTNGKSYLIGHDGYLFQSPISWYSQKQIWDLSPGFAGAYPTQRAVGPGCLFCHSNRALAEEDLINHYREPVFEGTSIGCERCHGPGELHVQARTRGDDPGETDYTIVNPRRLETHLRDAVCEQCHLQGEDRILRRGRHTFDYRPGLPLHLFKSIFVRRPEFQEKHKAVGQVEQMYDSRCYQASKGALGCISCHDPHRKPEGKEAVAYYRERCVECHRESEVRGQRSEVSNRKSEGPEHEANVTTRARLCSLDLEMRKQKTTADSCIVCHMPRSGSSDIVHTAVTDHRILRKPKADEGSQTLAPLADGSLPIVHFHRQFVDADDPEVARDLALAIIGLGRSYPGAQGSLGRLALPVLEKAVDSWPEDVAAREALGYALWSQGSTREALATFEVVLEQSPRREQTLRDAATICEQLGIEERALELWKRSAAANPWAANPRYRLAHLLAQRQEWKEAIAECSKAVQIMPPLVEPRVLLIDCYLRSGQKDRAGAEFAALEILNPAEMPELRRWFAEKAK